MPRHPNLPAAVSDPTLADRLFAALQYPLPHHALSRAVHWLARRRAPWLRRPLIRAFIRLFRVDMTEAADPDPDAYPHFNAFFTRALKPQARPLPTGQDLLVSPVDAVISQCGSIQEDGLFQAKGRTFSLRELLGGTPAQASAYLGGRFATLYLSPRDYHRIHMPAGGRLREGRYIPGRLFSVNGATTRAVPRLFARNERVVLQFDTALGPMALVLVGAMLVGSIETRWAGEITPPHRRRPARIAAGEGEFLARGEELGRFNMGSTVILCLPPGPLEWDARLLAQTSVRVNQPLARAPLAVHLPP